MSKKTLEKRSMGFRMSSWDDKLIKYGEMFEAQMMSLTVNIPLEEALDRGWTILAACFKPEETGFRSELVKEFWPKKQETADEKVAEEEPEAVEEKEESEVADGEN